MEPPLPHDPSCVRCGHPRHVFLPCSDTCTCEGAPEPGVYATAWADVRIPADPADDEVAPRQPEVP